MNRDLEHQRVPIYIDGLLQDSYLLVVALRNGRARPHGRDLWRRCNDLVETLRQALEERGMNPRNIDYISYAQCALLDETVLGYATDDDHAAWAGEPLQVKFFNRHQAGHFLYEDMHEVLRESTPDRQVMTAYHRTLLLGFKGRYGDLQDTERQRLIRALEMRIVPLVVDNHLSSGTAPGRSGALGRWLRSPVTQLIAVALLAAVTWWALDKLLARLVTSLMPGAV